MNNKTNNIEYEEDFKLGNLLIERPHPVTKDLSKVASKNIFKGIKLLLDVDKDVIKKYKEIIKSKNFIDLVRRLEKALLNNNRIFFYGCGSTGRLSILADSMWRIFWQKIKNNKKELTKRIPDRENSTCGIMTGGDYALIKSVEGYEDYISLGKYQIEKEGVKKGDVLLALTGTAETSTVIGAALKGVEKEADVFFIYGVPLDSNILSIKRARGVLLNKKIHKINITTGPMAITGSTRMQSSTMQQLTVTSALEIALSRYLLKYLDESEINEFGYEISDIDDNCLYNSLNEIYNKLNSESNINEIAKISLLEEDIYSANRKVNYLTKSIMLDVFTDTTERNPTFSIPPFRKKDEINAAQSWAYVINPFCKGEKAWKELLHRDLNCLVLDTKISKKISESVNDKRFKITNTSKGEMLKFPIGIEALKYRETKTGDGVITILYGNEKSLLVDSRNIVSEILCKSIKVGAKTGVLFFGNNKDIRDISKNNAIKGLNKTALIELKEDKTILEIWKHVIVKIVLNTISTITMVRLKRVEGNCMICVLPTNKKLYDRGTRFISQITGADYNKAYNILMNVMEYLEPKIKKGESIPPPILFASERIKNNLLNIEAERLFNN